MSGEKTVNKGFHHLALKASDFETSHQFYTEVLGLEEAHSWEGEDGPIALLDAGGGNYLELFAGGTGKEGEEQVIHFAFESEDPDAAIEEVREAGMEVTMEPENIDIPSDPALPVRVAFCKGPDGETIEFFKTR